MRNKLIDQYGAYKEMGFTGTQGYWKLIGSESIDEGKSSVMSTLDTFKSDRGEFKTMARSEVDKLFEEGKITL